MIICGKCKRPIDVIDGDIDAEVCWFCEAWLCGKCWELYGHCGHWEADEINREARERYDKLDVTE